jgi:hypothetical protein
VKQPVKFSSLQLGDKFDWTASERPSFFDTCVKTGARTYQSVTTLIEYRVGSIHAICNDLRERDTSVDFISPSRFTDPAYLKAERKVARVERSIRRNVR